MSNRFPSRDHLSAMSLDMLHSQIPYDKDDENLLQEIIDTRFKPNIIQDRVYRGDVPDIRTKDEEEKWQKIIDERTDKIKAVAIGEENIIKQNIVKMEEAKSKLEEELKTTENIEEPIKEKKILSCIKNYGVKYPIQNKDIKEKTKQTNLERYGVEYPLQKCFEDTNGSNVKILREAFRIILDLIKIKKRYISPATFYNPY